MRYFILFTLTTCGSPIDLNNPIEIDIAPAPIEEGVQRYDSAVVKSELVAALHELGATEGRGGFVLRVRPNTTEQCGNNSAQAGALGAIGLCPLFVVLFRDQISRTLRHELGHVFGAHHATCESGSIMAPTVECVVTQSYSAFDIANICSSGIVSGGVCSRH